MIQDCDVLLPPHHVRAACEVLRGLGFSPRTCTDLDSWIRHLEDRVVPAHEYVVLANGDDVEIDLHWRLGTAVAGGLAPEEVFCRAETPTLLGRSIRVAGPADAMALAAHHAARSAYALSSTVKDLVDLAEWWEVREGRWTPEEVADHALRAGVGAPLLALWRILAEFDAGLGAETGVAALCRKLPAVRRAEAGRFRELFRLQLAEGQVSKPLVLLLGALSPGSVRGFLRSRARRIRGKRGRPGTAPAAELPFRSRVGALLRELRTLRPARIRLLRAVAAELTRYHETNRAERAKEGGR
jgi:hypothetical protein